MAIRFSDCNFLHMGDEFFDFWRAVTRAIGVDIRRMEGFGGCMPWRSIDDAIAPFLAATSQTGSLPPERCRAVAKRLRELARDWPVEDFARQVAIELSDGLETAAYYNRPFKWYVD